MNLYSEKSINEPMLSYDKATYEYTCGSCHILAYEMLKQLPDHFRIGLLEEHCFIVDAMESTCYDISGSLPVEDFMEKWAEEWEEWFQTYELCYIREFVEVANDMYIEDITPNVDNWTMRSAKYWAEKMVKAIECGASNELNEAYLKYKYEGTTVNVDKILEKHLQNLEPVV